MTTKFSLLLLLLSISFSSFAVTSEEQNNITIFQDSVNSVVHVSNIKLASSRWSFNSVKIPKGSGTGIVWDKKGHIVTNYHVVHGGNLFLISFHKDNKQYEATLVGAAPEKDIAILKLKTIPENLKPLSIGSSNDLKVGQKAIAIGNPFGLDHSMSLGIISALNRKIPGFGRQEINGMIQTDASINPGNSGGPLLNSNGKLIGINTMIFSQSGSSAGVGFAVPVNMVKSIVPQLITHGRIIRPKMEMTIMPASVAGLQSGIIIESLLEGGAGDRAGLKGITRSLRTGRVFLGDIIIKINGKSINYDTVFVTLNSFKPGDIIKIEFIRDGKAMNTNLTLSK